MHLFSLQPVTPAKAGAYFVGDTEPSRTGRLWVPAFAGMTKKDANVRHERHFARIMPINTVPSTV
jgi:hypothetical protein